MNRKLSSKNNWSWRHRLLSLLGFKTVFNKGWKRFIKGSKKHKSSLLSFALLGFEWLLFIERKWMAIYPWRAEKQKKSKLVAKGDISHAHCNRVKQTAYRVKHTNKNYEKEIIVLWLFWFLSKIVNPKVFFAFWPSFSLLETK